MFFTLLLSNTVDDFIILGVVSLVLYLIMKKDYKK